MAAPKLTSTRKVNASEWDGKRAELLSGVGAIVLGVGIGALTASMLQPYAAGILVVGMVVHGWGMFAKHRIEQSTQGKVIWWSNAAYWICWTLLALLFLTLSVRFFLR